ncbi:MAG: NADH-quinone oxidoreductase subunit K [Campylobacterota bacterium]
MSVIYVITASALLTLGAAGFLRTKDIFKRLIHFNLFTSGIFLLFIALTYTGAPDAAAVALVLTGLVVSLGATALGLMLLRTLQSRGG